MFNTDCHIEIPADRLIDAVKLAYEMSAPQGFGFLHYKQGALSDEDAQEIIEAWPEGDIAASMDYVHGRSCKFHVYRDDCKLFVGPSWYDHSDAALVELLTALGVGDPRTKIDAAQAAQQAANEKYRREREEQREARHAD